MLLSTNNLRSAEVHATDGAVGRIDDCYFDSAMWTIRYLVVDTGTWMGRNVLISPISVGLVDSRQGTVQTSLTQDQIRNSPEMAEHQPISRQYEQSYGRYYGYSPYWIGAGYWGAGAYPGVLAQEAPVEARLPSPRVDADDRLNGDPHLRSCREVTGYHIEARDGSIGHIDDFLLDPDSWAVRYLRIDTSNFIGGDALLVPVSAIDRVGWPDHRVFVHLTQDQIRNSPPYDEATVRFGSDEAVRAYYQHTR
jgi:hypothetical protein